jgi:hypothetical protein
MRSQRTASGRFFVVGILKGEDLATTFSDRARPSARDGDFVSEKGFGRAEADKSP